MNWSYSYKPDIWPAIIALAMLTYLGTYSWRRRHIPAAKPFTIGCILSGLWALGVILELSAADFPTKVFWVKFQAIWQLPLGAVVTCFIFQYAGLGRWLTRRNYVLLFLVPLLCALLMATNDFHYLIWTGFRMNRYIVASPGGLYWLFNSYIFLLGLVNLAVLIRLAMISPTHRLPVAIIVCGQIIVRIGYALEKLETGFIGPAEIALLIIGMMAGIYGWALLSYHAIDPVAAARDAVRQQMREGLIVLDLQGKIVDVNPMVSEILGIPENSLRGNPLAEVMPVDAGLIAKLENQRTDFTEITLEKDRSARQYNLNLTELRGKHNEVIGQLLLLHDVTEQKKAQTKILEQQRVVATLQERDRLARELHDGIGQILGYVSMQVQTALKWARDGNQAKAEALLGRVMEVSKDAHADVRESILNLRTGSGQNGSLIPALKKYVDRFQANYGIRIVLSISDGIGENTFDPAAEVQLLRVIQEAMTNCRKHSGAQVLKIDMGVDGNGVTIAIGDDGRGFDADHVNRGDGEHFGLVFMRERMEQIGGALRIDSTPEGGTVIRLDAPIRTQVEDAI